jgi:dTDP-4-amino-4,6-dideoxygalactose transaminase
MSGQPSILFSDPDMSLAELEAVEEVLKSPGLSGGPVVEDFEAAFAEYLGRQYAVAVSSAPMGLLLALRAYGIGPGDEVIASPFGFRETAHAITLAGAKPVFVDIDYWTCTIVPDKAAAAVTPQTKAILACNVNGHPAL